MTYGLYLHVPFCPQHCHYCAFPISLAPEGEHAPYVRRLLAEIEMATLPGGCETLYLGGGTPSLLAPDLLEGLFGAVEAGAGEVSIEANPGTLDASRVEAYRNLGINRVSLGAQSFDAGELERMGRLHSPSDIVEDFDLLRRKGFDNVNLDLIAGFAGQERGAWERTLDRMTELGPEHVSVYLLELDEGSFWKTAPSRVGREDEVAWFYTRAAERLESQGYIHYEISNWALPGRECRHNRGYWTGRPYRGLGLGAHSFIEGERFWNTRSMSEYAERIDRGVLPVEETEAVTPSRRVQEAFLLGLRRLEGFQVFQVAEELGFVYPQDWFDRLDRLERAGLVALEGGVLKLTSAGCLVAGGITEELLCPELMSICEATR